MLTLALLALQPSFADTYPPDAVIADALAIQIPPQGLDMVTALVPELLPERIDLGTVGDSADGWLGCFGGYEYELSNAWVGIQLTDATVRPAAGALYLDADLLVNINDATDKFNIYTDVSCVSGSCPGYISPFPVTVSTAIALEVIESDTGAPTLDATIGDITVSYSDLASAIELDCALGTVEEVLNWFGLSLYDFIIGLLDSTLQGMIADMGPELEAQIEDAFSAAVVDQEMDLNGVTMTIHLFPRDVNINDAGVELVMSGAMSAEPAACTEAYDPGGSLRTDSAIPALTSVPQSSHMGLQVSDDMANQAMYALWRGGLLCYELQGDDPLPINTSLLGLLAGDSFNEIFPESKPMIIATRPKAAPTMNWVGDHDVNIDVQDLGLNFYAEVDDRMALALGINIDAVAGLDPVLNGATGELGLNVALSGDNVAAEVISNELVKGTDELIEENFAGVFDSLLGSLLGGLLGDLSFALPNFSGLGLTDLSLEPGGDQGDWLSGYATLGPVSYPSSGCDSGGGCGGGCSSGEAQARAFWLLSLPFALVFVRRRRRA